MTTAANPLAVLVNGWLARLSNNLAQGDSPIRRELCQTAVVPRLQRLIANMIRGLSIGVNSQLTTIFDRLRKSAIPIAISTSVLRPTENV